MMTTLGTESWELARRQQGNFEQVFGTIILLKMFEYEPQTKQVFGFAVDYNPTPQELKDSGRLQIAMSIIQRLDAVLNMLGPDAEMVSWGCCKKLALCRNEKILTCLLFHVIQVNEILDDLGKRHVKYGVKAVRRKRSFMFDLGVSSLTCILIVPIQEYIPFMGKAIIYALSEKLGQKWSSEDSEAWQIVYTEISTVMMKGILSG